MNTTTTTIESTEIPANELSCQDTPFITNDGIEIMPPYDTVDGIDPTCFTHDGKKIPYKSTNYYKYQVAIAQHQDSEILRASLGYPPSSPPYYDTWIIQQQQLLEKPVLARDTCMNDLQRQSPFEFGNLSESNLKLCSSYGDSRETENMINELLGIRDSEPDNGATSLPYEQPASSTIVESSPNWLQKYPRLFQGRVSVLQNPKSNMRNDNDESVDETEESLYNDIYEPDDEEMVDMCKLNMLDTAGYVNEWVETNRHEIPWLNNYDWVKRMYGHSDFELFKDLLVIDPTVTATATDTTATTCLSQYSDCFESNDDTDVELVQLHEIELPLTSEDGPIAEPKRMQRLTGEEFTRQDLIEEAALACKAFAGNPSTTNTITETDRIRGYRFVPDIEYGCDGKDLPHNDYNDYDDFHYNI